MALSLSSLKSTESSAPPIVLFYGVDGVGKTSLAAEFPDALYVPTVGERAPKDVVLPTPGTVESFDDLLDIGGDLLTENHEFKTVIFDSLDGIEPLVWAATCKRIGATSIDDNAKDSPASYGRGFREADVEWNEYLSMLAALQARGIAVVQLSHPGQINFKSPITDPYDRYEIKINKRAAALVREKSDIVGFINYRITLKSVDTGFKKTATHAEGGVDRLINLEERAGFLAKNRYSMPASVPYKKGSGYAELSKHFPAPTGVNDGAN